MMCVTKVFGGCEWICDILLFRTHKK